MSFLSYKWGHMFKHIQFTLLFRGHFVFKPTAKEHSFAVFSVTELSFAVFSAKEYSFAVFFRERIFFRGFSKIRERALPAKQTAKEKTAKEQGGL